MAFVALRLIKLVRQFRALKDFNFQESWICLRSTAKIRVRQIVGSLLDSVDSR